jgi:hypothetical protein
MVTLRALQPQVRIALWRFMFSLQAGFEFRTGQITGFDPPDFMPPTANGQFYNDGFMLLDLMVAGRLNVRFHIVDGFFFMGQANYTQYLIGETGTDGTSSFKSSSSWGFNVGFGYGF